jgi:hypothetical protein
METKDALPIHDLIILIYKKNDRVNITYTYKYKYNPQFEKQKKEDSLKIIVPHSKHVLNSNGAFTG